MLIGKKFLTCERTEATLRRRRLALTTIMMMTVVERLRPVRTDLTTDHASHALYTG